MYRRWFRGLRPRLTLSYVLFFTVLLSFLGLFFTATLRGIYRHQVRDLLTEDWGAIRGYLRTERGRPLWFYDPRDPDENFAVERLRRVFLLTTDQGRVIMVSAAYQQLGIDTPQYIAGVLRNPTPVWSERVGRNGEPFLLLSGLFVENRQRYYLSIGRSMAESDRVAEEFQWNYFLFLPLMIAVGSVFGWIVAGRALEPLDQLANTAQRITGSNLAAHIPERGAGDELDRLIGAFNRMIERLDASFTQTRQFSTDVSHELRTPLTAIRGQLEVALFTARSTDEYREAIENALQDVDRLSHTIRALLLLSQAESGRLALQKQRLDLSAIAADIVEQFEIPAEAAQVELTAKLAPGCIIDADRVQVERLLSNLLSNAVKYTPEGGHVHVSVACGGDDVELRVADTGVGIPPDHLPHIFDRFYRVPDRNPERGLGLGLSFVEWIVKAHGGRIEVASMPGQGTTFHVWLPAAPQAPAPPEVGAARQGLE